MACKHGRCRMSAIARFLKNEDTRADYSTEEVVQERKLIRSIQRQFQNACEANLLDEEDMRLFGSRPLMDPLHLVRCNTCKKPVKETQFAAHGEICKLTNSQEDITMGSGNKRPPRKGRKNGQLAINNQTIIVPVQEKSEPIQEVGGLRVPDSVVNFERQRQSYMHSSLPGETKDTPVPLATKVYRLQANSHLRMALSYLYHKSSLNQLKRESWNQDATNVKAAQSSEVSPLGGSLHENFTNLSEDENNLENHVLL